MAKDRLPPPKHLQSVVEWRYPKAHRYWDDCGKLITAIESSFPGLECQGLEDKGFRFEGQSRGITGAVFYWDRASIAQVGQGDAGLPVAASDYWNLVREGLGTAEPTRFGHRTWLCYETANPRAAEKWLERTTIWTLADTPESLGAPRVSGTVLRTRLADGVRRLRLEIGSGTFTIKGQTTREHHGVIADADIVAEPPGELIQDVEDYIRWNIRFIGSSVNTLFR